MNNFCDTYRRYKELKIVFDTNQLELDINEFKDIVNVLSNIIERNEVVLGYELMNSLTGNSMPVNSVVSEYDAVTRSGIIVTGGGNSFNNREKGNIAINNIVNGEIDINNIDVLDSFRKVVKSVDVDYDPNLRSGIIVAILSNNTVHVYSIKDGKINKKSRQIINGFIHAESDVSIDFDHESGSGLIAKSDGSFTTKIYSMKDNKLIKNPIGSINNSLFSSNITKVVYDHNNDTGLAITVDGIDVKINTIVNNQLQSNPSAISNVITSSVSSIDLELNKKTGQCMLAVATNYDITTFLINNGIADISSKKSIDTPFSVCVKFL